jgi:hypothetical protein
MTSGIIKYMVEGGTAKMRKSSASVGHSEGAHPAGNWHKTGIPKCTPARITLDPRLRRYFGAVLLRQVGSILRLLRL